MDKVKQKIATAPTIGLHRKARKILPMRTESAHCQLYRNTLQLSTIFALAVVGTAHSLQNETISEVTARNTTIPMGFKYDTARIPKVYPLSTIKKVLTNILGLRKKGISVTTPSSSISAAKIECKEPTDLIIVYDNTDNVNEKQFPKVLDFVATVSAAWRSNLKCHVSVIPQSAMVPGEINDFPFSETIKKDEYQMKASVFRNKRIYNTKSNLVDAFNKVNEEINEHLPGHGLPINVLLLTATYKMSEIQDAGTMITKLTNKMHINTLVIGVSERKTISEGLLLKFANNKDKNFKLISNFDDLKFCYEFLKKHLVAKPNP